MDHKREKKVFISWAPYSRRSQSLASKLDIPLYQIHYLKFQKPAYAPLKYLLQTIHSLILLSIKRPRVVFVQTPPVFACLSVYLYSVLSLRRARFIIDAHNGSFFHPFWKPFRGLQKFLFRRAVTVITTNPKMTDIVKSWGAPSIPVAGPPLAFPPGKAKILSDRFNIVLVNTFSPDEPLSAAIRAAAGRPDIHLYVTGDKRKAPSKILADKPDNVTFTDFLPDEDYIALLRGADAIMVLTVDDNTLQLGAMEAVALGKPIITSDLSFLRSQFPRGTLYVPNTPEGVGEGITRMKRDRGNLSDEILDLGPALEKDWMNQFQKLREILNTQS